MFGKVTYALRLQVNPSRSEPMNKALRLIGNPRKQCERVWQLASKLCEEIERKSKNPGTKGKGRILVPQLRSAAVAPFVSDQKLYEGETWDLACHRWKKLVKEFRQKNEDGSIVYEISKIQDIYDVS